jgi:EAL domain-containing protein (putative c-di-GMP-specific phosphodiesterase class I)
VLADADMLATLKLALDNGGVDVIADASDVSDLLEALEQHHTDLVVVDLASDPTAMVDAVVQTRRRSPGVEIHVVVHGGQSELVELAESAGADLVVPLDPIEHVRDSHRKASVRRIERAIEGEGLHAVYQPIVNLRTGRVAGLEAFTRFVDGAGVTPYERFEEAQHLGLRRELEQAAVVAAAQVIDQLPTGWFLAVNLSPSTLAWDRFVAGTRNLPLGRMWLELNLRDGPGTWFGRLADLWAGVRERPQMVLDDAGVSSASLKAIQQLEPDVVKLAPELVRAVDHRPDQQALVSTLGVYAKETGVVLVAEGVENQAEADCLEGLGVRFAQGFLFGPVDVLTKEHLRDLKRR